MTRLFLPPERLAEEKITISGEEARYLSLVLRARPGEQLMIFDGTGSRYICRIFKVHKKEVVVEKIKKEPYCAESPVSITLAQGLPKADKMDLIVQKSTELGVHRIIPLITERSQVRHTEKTGRWRKIAMSASQQCGRDAIPEIEEPVKFEEFVIQPALPLDKGRTGEGPLKIIFSEEREKSNLKKIFADYKDIRKISIMIGPEGGFTHEEAGTAVDNGFIEVSLGPRILRTETAPIAAISIIEYMLGDMG
ncbi:MAG: 16S rRNA (uracil(1498)-N(3))-methyltransferase [Nitrospirae bacterium]|nr:16S rRNA (uracil(1498)-N(3))-methyltransferase [Nitrospirota bacterium]